MRTIDEYMKLPYKMEIIPDTEEGGYAVSFPDLPGCLTVGNAKRGDRWHDRQGVCKSLQTYRSKNGGWVLRVKSRN